MAEHGDLDRPTRERSARGLGRRDLMRLPRPARFGDRRNRPAMGWCREVRASRNPYRLPRLRSRDRRRVSQPSRGPARLGDSQGRTADASRAAGGIDRCTAGDDQAGGRHLFPQGLAQSFADRLVGHVELHRQVAQGPPGSRPPKLGFLLGGQSAYPWMLVRVTPRPPDQPTLGDGSEEDRPRRQDAPAKRIRAEARARQVPLSAFQHRKRDVSSSFPLGRRPRASHEPAMASLAFFMGLPRSASSCGWAPTNSAPGGIWRKNLTDPLPVHRGGRTLA